LHLEYEHDAVLVADAAYEQRVVFADGSELVTETGWELTAAPDPTRRPGPRWVR
jgi:hypothetical protein